MLAAPAAGQQRGLPRDWDRYVQAALTTFRVPGLAIAVVKDDKVLLARGYGVRRLGDTAKVDAHTYFQIASNTKAFTTAAIAMLTDSGVMAWGDPVTKYLPWFELSDPWVTREFTITDLVTHRSGLGLGAGDLLWFHSDYPREEVVRRLRYARPATSFRTAYAYDNVLYIAAGLALESAAHTRWSDFIKQRIFTPLGMTESGTDVALMSSADASTPHALEHDTVRIVPLDTVQNTEPAGAIVSNVSDLTHWLMVQLDSGRMPDGRRLWNQADAKRLWAAQTILGIPDSAAGPIPDFETYGLGWHLTEYRGHKLVWHTGGLAGQESRTTLVPDLKLGIVILTNAESDIYHALTYRLLDHFFGAPATDWSARYAFWAARDRASADSIERVAAQGRDTTGKPPLPLAKYAGTYSDRMYGDAAIALEGDHLVLRFSHSAALTGDLEYWGYGAFRTHWRATHVAEAYVTFALRPDGTVDHFTMQAVSPLADFSFDYQDLYFEPRR